MIVIYFIYDIPKSTTHDPVKSVSGVYFFKGNKQNSDYIIDDYNKIQKNVHKPSFF